MRVGVYVDAENIRRNGGYRMQYRVLRDIACRDDGVAVRLNTYPVFDDQQAAEDDVYRRNMLAYYSAVRDAGFKIIEKKVQHFVDAMGQPRSKANADLDMAVDCLMQSERLDRVMLVTGDGDFVQVVRALQNRGCRVEVLAFDNVSGALRREADAFVSGYLVPGFVPTTNRGAERPWGESGSRVRGACYYYPNTGEVGFFRYLKHATGDLWIKDEREEGSPYGTAAFHVKNLPTGFNWPKQLPSREMIFEFTLQLAEGYDRPRANDITISAMYPAV